MNVTLRQPKIFLSMVTSEFGQLRNELVIILRPVFDVRSQEYEAQSPLDMLSALEQRVCNPSLGNCALMIHVVGSELGFKPAQCEWQHYCSCNSDSKRLFTTNVLVNLQSLTYTQFESHIAIAFGIDQFIYRREPNTPGSEQERHLRFLHRSLGREATPYQTKEELKNIILRDILLFAVTQFGRSSESTEHIINAPAMVFLRNEIETTKAKIVQFSGPLITWPKEVKNAGWLERAELLAIQNRIEKSEFSTTLVVGPPGSGKSALLSKLAQWGLDKGFAVLGIKSDLLDRQVTSVDILSRFILEGELGLVDKLRNLSAAGPVFVLIDQLDAVGSLSDLETGRLNAVLDFIRAIANTKSIHLIASVRSFELKADQRLSAIAQPENIVELAGLQASQVHEALKANSIDSSKWPTSYIDFLRVPYHLSLFVRAFDSQSQEQDVIPEAILFSSIHAIHDQRWDQLVTDTVETKSKTITDVFFSLSEKISDTEVLWHPRAEFSSLSDDLFNELEALGWLTQSGDLLGFAHQTQYEFILAKRFCGAPDGFFNYVWIRRNRLTVRPVVWHVLSYLRDRDFVGYVQVMGRLFAQIERRHLQRLLLEFLAEVPAPTQPEVGWLRGYLESEKHYAVVCWLLRDKRPWFEALPDHCFINLMKWDLHNAWPVTRLLETTIRFAFDKTKSLIRSAWAFKSTYATHVAQVLHEAEQFDDETIAWAHACCVDATASTWASQRLIDHISEVSPERAPRILASKLERYYVNAVQTKPEPAPKQGDFAKEEDYVVETLVHLSNINDRLKPLLECEGLFKVGELAGKVPREFFRCMWPWFKKVVTSCSANDFRCYNQFRVEYGMQRWFGLHRNRQYSILSALESAIQRYAKLNPFEYLQTVTDEQQLDSMTCQRLLAHGLISIAHQVPDFILEYFMSDERRLLIGDDDGGGSTFSVRLLLAAGNYWNREQQAKFQDFVLAATLYPDSRPNEWRQRSVNRLRSNFLILIPQTHRSIEATQLIEKVLLESPDAFAPRERLENVGMSRVVSPVQASAMENMSAERLVVEIQNLPDSTGRDHPTDWRLGGSEMLAGEFSKFAEANPSKAIEVIGQLKSNENEMVAGGGLRGLRTAKEHQKATLDLISELITNGFSSDRFKDDVGQCVYQIALDRQGLPEDLCQVMENWLVTADVKSDPPAESDEKQRASDGAPQAILWQHGGLYTLPHEHYWLGEAIKLGHCLASSPRDDHWYGYFERLVNIKFTSKVWEAWLWQLCRYVPNRDRIAPHIANLLTLRSDVRSNLAGYWALACYFRSMEPETRAELLNMLLTSSSADDQQVAAEIATYVGYPSGDPTSIQLVDDALEKPNSNSNVRSGIAFAAAELWMDQIEHRELSLRLLKKLFENGCHATSNAVMSIFNYDKCLDSSDLSRRLLELAMNNLQFDRVREVWPLVRHLTNYMESEPRLTLDVCRQIVDRVRQLGTNETTARLSMSEEPLVSIALTLHRSPDPQLAAEALTLFEDLLDLQAHDAFNKLRELDGRFTKR